MKILAIGTSNNRQSINRTLATYTASLADHAEVKVLDIADYELPIYSAEREQALGKPDLAQAVYRQIGDSDALVISFAEHNGSYTAAWKNLFDWMSRINMRVFQDKPTVYLSTSPGAGGAASVLAAAVNSAPYFGVQLVDSVSVPSFHDNYDKDNDAVSDPKIRARLQQAMDALEDATTQKDEEVAQAMCA